MRNLAIILLLLTTAAHAEDENCMGVFVNNSVAWDVPEVTAKAGEKYEFITQFVIDLNTRNAYLCSHGSYCFPAKDIKLLTCKIGTYYHRTKDEQIFELVMNK